MSRISLIVVRRARCRAAGIGASLLAKASASCKKRPVDEAVVNELEAAIADIGALLVRVRKYRRGQTGAGATLLDEALALRDRARRLHRHEALDPAAARAPPSEAEALAPRGEPVVPGCAAGVCGQRFYRLTATGEFLVYALRLRAPLTILLRRTLEGEDDEAAPVYPAWRSALAAALTAAGVPLEDA